MNTSELCDQVILHLNGITPAEEQPDYNPPSLVKAVSSYIKTHRLNVHNVFEIFDVMWKDAEMTVRELGDYNRAQESAWVKFLNVEEEIEAAKSMVIFDVKFPDGSMGIIVSGRGIGVEYIHVA